MGKRHRNRNAVITAAKPPVTINRGAQTASSTVQVRAAMFMGPLPPAAELANYEAALPGTADRIIRQYEEATKLTRDQAEHRFGLENKVVDGNLKGSARGTYCATFLGALVIIVGGLLLYFDKQVGGLGAIITGFATLAGVFVYGTRRQAQDVGKKRAADILRDHGIDPRILTDGSK